MSDPDEGVRTGPATWARRCEDLARRQRLLIEQLGALTTARSELLDRGDDERAAELIGARRRFIGLLGRVGLELARLRAEHAADGGVAGREAGEWLAAQLEASAGALRNIIEQDEADRSRLAALRDRAGERLAGVTRGRAAVGAYTRDGRRTGGVLRDEQA